MNGELYVYVCQLSCFINRSVFKGRAFVAWRDHVREKRSRAEAMRRERRVSRRAARSHAWAEELDRGRRLIGMCRLRGNR